MNEASAVAAIDQKSDLQLNQQIDSSHQIVAVHQNGNEHHAKPNNSAVQEIGIGARCHVHWRNTQDLPAVVIDRRLSKRQKLNNTTTTLGALPPDQLDYYVHYVDHDRYVTFCFCSVFAFINFI